MKIKTLPKLELHLCFLNPKSINVEYQALLEDKKIQPLRKRIKDSIIYWKNINEDIKGYDSKSNVYCRLTQFSPSHYLIGIKDQIFISPYVAERGSQSFYEIYSRLEAPTHFEVYRRLLDKFHSDNIAHPINWDEAEKLLD